MGLLKHNIKYLMSLDFITVGAKL